MSPQMAQYYAAKCGPIEYPVRSKCIALFQTIHGVDTLLFALYVYEYGQECPAPNKRRVYISYLDSVQYFEPKCYRTTAYHAILIEYLRYVKERGFHTAHLWSCPPTPGDDYIFYCHPEHQKIPREDMLRTWYHKMLDKAKSQGVVIRTTTLYDEYFTDSSVDPVPGQRYDATCLPYFEGDYIPGEVENIIRQLRTQGGGTGSDNKDAVMVRLGHNVQKMKDNFIVVHMRNRRFAAAVERGEDVSNWREDSDEEVVRSKRAKISGKDSSLTAAFGDGRSADTESKPAVAKPEALTEDAVEDSNPADEAEAQPGEPAQSDGQPDGGTGGDPEVPTSLASNDATVESQQSGPDTVQEKGSSGQPNEATPAPDDIQECGEKRGVDEIKPAISKHFAELKRMDKVVSDTSEEDETIESEMFESRQQLLNYCQTTHCQFDELRRAKHSSMMVLFQLHNPTAPKFLQQCGSCYLDITHGTRYHCNNCPDFDLCQDCYKPVTTGLWAKRDPRFAHDKAHAFTAVNTEATLETKASREERQKALKAHLTLLEHAGNCSGAPACSLQNCQRMKGLFEHVRTCEVKPKKDCRICSRLLSLCAVHSRMCNVRGGACPIPFCDRIRERHMRLRRQQQHMDDRRRRAQNELYHAGDAK